MQVLIKEEVDRRKDVLHMKLREGALFVYPTDTIYGIGCNALDDKAVQKVRDIKERPERPFSVIAPSKEWIYENCGINPEAEEWIRKLPGPYTLVLRQKNKRAVSKHVNPGTRTLAVRIPDHWIADFVAEFGAPIITPSANVSGNEPMTSLEDMDPRLRAKVDFILDEGEKKGSPSQIVDLTSKPKLIVR